jgi:hypothetical protein
MQKPGIKNNSGFIVHNQRISVSQFMSPVKATYWYCPKFNLSRSNRLDWVENYCQYNQVERQCIRRREDDNCRVHSVFPLVEVTNSTRASARVGFFWGWLRLILAHAVILLL